MGVLSLREIGRGGGDPSFQLLPERVPLLVAFGRLFLHYLLEDSRRKRPSFYSTTGRGRVLLFRMKKKEK